MTNLTLLLQRTWEVLTLEKAPHMPLSVFRETPSSPLADNVLARGDEAVKCWSEPPGTAAGMMLIASVHPRIQRQSPGG